MKRVALRAAWLLIAAVAHGASSPDGWPEGWRAASERFERFLSLRAQRWPVSRLKISPDGRVDLAVPTGPHRRTLLELYAEGAVWTAPFLDAEELAKPLEVLTNWAQSSRYQAAVVLTDSPLGDQHVPPLVWFDVVNPTSERDLTLFSDAPQVVVPIKPPEPASDWWPNDRMIAWLDYQVLPNHEPEDIRKANRKVDPAVFLQVDQRGVIHRVKLASPVAEAALRWRIFCNGRLVEDGSATDCEQLPTAPHGTGNYIALAGVVGPKGFFPVSNLLRYYLAPVAGKELRLLFDHASNGDSTTLPNWFRAYLPPPDGTGPVRFSNRAEMEAAQTILSVWRASTDDRNDPDAGWIYEESPPAAPR